MNPVVFAQHQFVMGKSQSEYIPLPVHSEDGIVTSCWSLSWRERFTLLFTGRLWLRQLTFGDKLQPQRPQVESPFK